MGFLLDWTDGCRLAKILLLRDADRGWTARVEITGEAYERTLDVFGYNGVVKRRYPRPSRWLRA